jgi:uncharacterized protein (TIGR00725 family)
LSGESAYVGVIGASAPSAEEYALAEEVGRAAGRRGAVVVTGGGRGVMEAACRGARSAGARTVGLLPGESRSEANAWVEVAIATGLGELRNGLIVRASDVLIAVGRGVGTLSEIALALKVGKPVVGLRTWDLGREAPASAGIIAAPDAGSAVERAFLLMGR